MNTRKTFFIFCFALCGLLFVQQASFAKKPLEKKVKRAAREWIQLVDNAQYEESYREASALFKSILSQERWVTLVKNMKKNLDRPLGRYLKKFDYQKTLPKLPRGHYVIMEFETKFAGKKNASEKIVISKDEDGDWKVSGYSIQIKN